MAERNEEQAQSEAPRDEQGNLADSPQTRNENPDAPAVMQGTPEPADTYVGALEYEVNPDPMEEALKQQSEAYPRVTGEEFVPEEHEPEEARAGASSTSRADVGRVVVVDYDLIHDGEVIKAGVQDLPLDLADALIADGAAWEPAGKKKGR